MKVNINSKEIQKGLIFKKTYYMVTCAVDFTPEEKAIIKKHNMNRLIIMERDRHADKTNGPPRGGCWNLEVYRLVDGPDEYIMATPAEAHEYEAILKESLKTLKLHLEANAGHTPTSTSFEL